MNHTALLIAAISGTTGILLAVAPSAITRLRRRPNRRPR